MSEAGTASDGAADLHRDYLSRSRFSGLDGLRALSVVAVVWHHTAAQGTTFLARGYLGVEFFFAISGFLITTLLLREFTANGRIDVRAFYARRSLRIFPLYYATLAGYVVLALLFKRHAPEGRTLFENLPAFATYTSNWFVDLSQGERVPFYFSWSLATEEQFYLFWAPLVVLVTSRGRPRLRLLAAVIAAVAVTDVVLELIRHSPGLHWRILTSISTPICLGALMAIVLHSRRGFTRIAPLLRNQGILLVLVLALVTAVAAPVAVDGRVIGALMALVVAACATREDSVLSPLLRWRPLAFVGSISYGVYLLHMLAANAVRPTLGLHHGPQLFVATLVTVLAMASASYFLFEKPILRYKSARFGRPTRVEEPVAPDPTSGVGLAPLDLQHLPAPPELHG